MKIETKSEKLHYKLTESFFKCSLLVFSFSSRKNEDNDMDKTNE